LFDGFKKSALINPRAEIGRERRRQIQVRKALEVCLGDAARQDHYDLAEFYLACGDYLLWSMDRLHDQDQLIHNLLRERLDPAATAPRKALAELEDRQAQSRDIVRRFRLALEKLRREGRRGLKAFETAARRFTNTFRSLLKPRRNPFEEHTDRLFKDRDWLAIAWANEQSRSDEQTLFVAVQLYAPAELDPAEFPAEHHHG